MTEYMIARHQNHLAIRSLDQEITCQVMTALIGHMPICDQDINRVVNLPAHGCDRLVAFRSCQASPLPGHWEGDLITGAQNRSSVGTLVERTTLFTVPLRVFGRIQPFRVSSRESVVTRRSSWTMPVRSGTEWLQSCPQSHRGATASVADV
jgi:hypothetical protein